MRGGGHHIGLGYRPPDDIGVPIQYHLGGKGMAGGGHHIGLGYRPTAQDHIPYRLPLPSVASTQVPLSHRFLLKTENLSLPLCYDVTGNVLLKLLHHPNGELFVNGELDSVPNGGFKRIVIHSKADLYEISTNGRAILQTESHQTEQESFTVIMRDGEMDVAAGDTRIVILIHDKHGQKLLWPVIRQQPSDNNVTGLIAPKTAVYEEVQQTPPTKLKIRDQEIDVSRTSTVDYSIASKPTLDCWLTSVESALQRRLDDFIVAQL